MCFSEWSPTPQLWKPRFVYARRLCQGGTSRRPAATNTAPDTRCLGEELRAAGWLCFQNEFSDVVWYALPRLFYKAFAEAKRRL